MSYPKEFAVHFIGVGGVVIHDEKVLLVQPKYGKSKGLWMIPGGFLEKGETMIEAVEREIFEETGMKVVTEGLLSVRTMVRNKDNTTDMYSIIKCKLTSKGTPLVPQVSEIDKAAWIPISDCFTNKEVSSYTKRIIKNAISSKPIIKDPPLTEERKKNFDIAKYEEFWIN